LPFGHSRHGWPRRVQRYEGPVHENGTRIHPCLRYHEQKLLRKVDFTNYTSDKGHRDALVSQRYHLQPNHYHQYNKLCGSLRSLAHKLAALDPADPFRIKHERLLLDKLWDMGILGMGSKGKLSDVENKVSVAAFARRRLPVVMQRLRMSEHLQSATKFVEQGHVRVGTEIATDPALLVTRNMEDFVTWVDSSKIKRNILKYRDKLDDFDLL